MPGLTDLPAELLYEIIFVLHNQSGHSSDLLGLYQSCKAFSVLLEPYVYKNLHLDFGDGERGNARALSLFTAFAYHPYRTSYVRLVEARNWHKNNLAGKVDTHVAERISAYLKRLVAACKLEHPPAVVWAHAIKHRVLDAWMALLISHLPDLQTLDLTFYPGYESYFVKSILANGITTQRQLKPESAFSTFRRLQTVRYSPERRPHVTESSDPFQVVMYENEKVSPEHVAPLFNLPNLEAIHLPCLGSPVGNATISTISDNPSPAKSLSITRGRITEVTLDSILHYTPSLSTLQYGASIDADTQHFISGQRILQGLQRISESLQTLQISLSFWRQYNAANNDESIIATGLGNVLGGPTLKTSFPSLINLEAPIALLLGWEVSDSPEIADVLPPSVETLLLSDDLAGLPQCEWDVGCFAAKIERLILDVAGVPRPLGLESNEVDDDIQTQLRRIVIKVANFHKYGRRYKAHWAPHIAELQRLGRSYGMIDVGVVWDDGGLDGFVDLDSLQDVMWQVPANQFRKRPIRGPPKSASSRTRRLITS